MNDGYHGSDVINMKIGKQKIRPIYPHPQIWTARLKPKSILISKKWKSYQTSTIKDDHPCDILLMLQKKILKKKRRFLTPLLRFLLFEPNFRKKILIFWNKKKIQKKISLKKNTLISLLKWQGYHSSGKDWSAHDKN